jgi:hypothetical protein
MTNERLSASWETRSAIWRRLLALAREQAFIKHAHYVLLPNTQGHVQGMCDREWGFSTCPHPDCAALRACAEAPETTKASDYDVCACGHYRSTHGHGGKICDGWMPGGTGHHEAQCRCVGFHLSWPARAEAPAAEPTEPVVVPLDDPSVPYSLVPVPPSAPPPADVLAWLVQDLTSRRWALWDDTRSPVTVEDQVAFARASEIETVLALIPLLAAECARESTRGAEAPPPTESRFDRMRNSKGESLTDVATRWDAENRAEALAPPEPPGK